MESNKYRLLLWEFIGALDAGKYDLLDIEEVKRHALAGTISSFLVDRFDVGSDFSFLDAKDWPDVDADFTSLANAVDARRKFGVENKGMSLLMAYSLEGYQRRTAEEKKESS